MPDRRIDFSDIPESTKQELRRARRLDRPAGRPKSGTAKQLIAIRIAPGLLARLHRLAAKQSKPYQTLIHELLELAANKELVNSDQEYRQARARALARLASGFHLGGGKRPSREELHDRQRLGARR
jgi:hypothetical protein